MQKVTKGDLNRPVVVQVIENKRQNENTHIFMSGIIMQERWRTRNRAQVWSQKMKSDRKCPCRVFFSELIKIFGTPCAQSKQQFAVIWSPAGSSPVVFIRDLSGAAPQSSLLISSCANPVVHTQGSKHLLLGEMLLSQNSA